MPKSFKTLNAEFTLLIKRLNQKGTPLPSSWSVEAWRTSAHLASIFKQVDAADSIEDACMLSFVFLKQYDTFYRAGFKGADPASPLSTILKDMYLTIFDTIKFIAYPQVPGSTGFTFLIDTTLLPDFANSDFVGAEKLEESITSPKSRPGLYIMSLFPYVRAAFGGLWVGFMPEEFAPKSNIRGLLWDVPVNDVSHTTLGYVSALSLITASVNAYTAVQELHAQEEK